MKRKRLKVEIIERDGKRCFFCDKRIFMSHTWRISPSQPTVHHVNHRETAEEFNHIDNLKMTHQDCHAFHHSEIELILKNEEENE